MSLNFCDQVDNISGFSRIDPDILNLVVSQGFDRESVIDWLKKRVQNEVTLYRDSIAGIG